VAAPASDRQLALAYLLVALLSLILFAFFIGIGFGNEAVPPKARLASVTGELRALSYSHSKNSDSLEFRVDGQPFRFEVSSQTADLRELHDAIEAQQGPLSLLYDAEDRRHPWWSEGDDFYFVYALERGGSVLLSYEGSREGYASGQRFVRWFSTLWLILAALMLHAAWRMRQPRPAADGA
jgi:hypothetical protein